MKRAVVFTIALAAIVIVLGPFNVLRRYIFPKVKNTVEMRSHLNTSNTTRVEGKDPEELGKEINRILYPSGSSRRPSAAIVVSAKDWKAMLSLMSLVKQYNSVIIPVDSQRPDEVLAEIDRMAPSGIRNLRDDSGTKDTEVIIAGDMLKNCDKCMKALEIGSRFIRYQDIDELQREVFKLFTTQKSPGEAGFFYVVPDSNPQLAIPAATLAVDKGGMVLYADKSNKLYSSSKDILAMVQAKKVYIMGQKNLANTELISTVKHEFVKVTGADAADLAIKVAKFYDPKTGLGWNANRRRDDVGHNFILASVDEPEMAVLSCQLALRGKSGPLLWTESEKLTFQTENYLWRMKPNYWITPSEGPFNNVWIVGSSNVINYSIQGKVDQIQELQPYETLGDRAVSGLDALSVIWFTFSLMGALWVGLHAFIRMSRLYMMVKIMWIAAALLLGPIGVWLYIICYINCPSTTINGNVLWLRPLWKQTAVASLRGLSYAAVVIGAVSYILTKTGLPLVPFSAPSGGFLLGNPLIVQMLIAYLVGLILQAYLFAPVLEMKIQNISYTKAVKKVFGVVVLSTTSEAAGLMATRWWLQMVYSPVSPSANNILWFGFFQLGALVGFLVTYVPNWWLVRYGKKMGTV